jgi:hypothetical protein
MPIPGRRQLVNHPVARGHVADIPISAATMTGPTPNTSVRVGGLAPIASA